MSNNEKGYAMKINVSGHHVEVYRNGGAWYTMADDISSEDIREYRVRAVLMHDDNWVNCDKCIF